jgi:hypothetical protein
MGAEDMDKAMAERGHDPVKSWGERVTKPLFKAQGTMPISQAISQRDPAFTDWGKFHSQEASYIHGLRRDIEHRGMLNPIQFEGQGDRTQIYDGHHRLAAAELAGHKEVPYFHREDAEQQWIDKDAAGRPMYG